MRAVTMKQIGRFARLVQTVAAGVSCLVADDVIDFLFVSCALY